jgi:CheY-like chemotaxis protein
VESRASAADPSIGGAAASRRAARLAHIAAELTSSRPEGAPAAAAVRQRPLVLCADDEEDILELVALRLERAGYDVARATDGEQALELARSLRPDVVVLDVMMPRRNGADVVRRLREDPATRDLRMILLSARVHESDVRQGIDVGADAYLGKPFRAPELIELVERLLSRSPQPLV